MLPFCIIKKRAELEAIKCTVSYLCIVMRTASLRPLTILPPICRVWCTKLQKHFNAISEVLYCFTIAIGLPGDALDYNDDKRSAVAARMQTRWLSCEAIVRTNSARSEILAIWATLKLLSSQKIKMMQYIMCCFTATCKNKKFQQGAFLLSTLAPHLTELSKVFQTRCFDFVQVKSSVELCINNLSDAAVKSELKANCEKFDSEFGERGTLDGLADSCVSRG